MIYVCLKRKINDLLKSKSTLLWLEGSKYEQVNHVQLKASTVVLSLQNGTIKLIQFDKYLVTLVGIQFWFKGRPGVLYKWDLPENVNSDHTEEKLFLSNDYMPDDDPPPPDMAA